jgi:hypothetical protein
VYQNDTTVNNIASFTLAFQSPVPLPDGCKLKLIIPDSVKFKKLYSVELLGMFGSRQKFLFTIDSGNKMIRIDNAC